MIVINIKAIDAVQGIVALQGVWEAVPVIDNLHQTSNVQ